jgi:Flp pilus assembly protein TadG
MGQFNFRRRTMSFAQPLLARVNRFSRNDRGNVAVVVALLIIPVSGLLSLAGEVSGWYAIQRSMQNAADSAAIAAASNGNVVSGTYVNEARSVAGYMNFVNGQNNTTVAPVSVFCPGGGLAECFKVTITKTVPLYLVQLVGYTGSNGNGTQTIVASAIAGTKNVTTTLCLTALATSGTTITVNGGPNVNMAGCNVGTKSTSGSAVKCTGNNWAGDPVGVASAGSSPSCGTATPYPNSTIVDNYSGYGAAYTPASPCGGVYSGSSWSGSAGSYSVCGNLTLNSNVTLTTSGTIYIYNGQLNLNGHTLSTASGVNATIVFDKVSGANYAPFAPSSGTLDIQAPASGNWSGIALYQYGLTAATSQTFSGSNSVQWNITGLVYLPKIDLQFNGSVNKSTNGAACTPIVVNTFRINGSNALSLLTSQNQCPLAGLNNPPSIVTSSRVALAG